MSWAEIYRWAEAHAERSRGSLAGFLSDQLREYLELTGLSPFSGFRREHFDYFQLSSSRRAAGEQSEIAEQIKARLDGLGGVIKELDPETYERLGEVRVGRMRSKQDHAWMKTHSGAGTPNLTVEVGAGDLQLNQVVWRADQVKQFRAWAEGRPTAATLRTLGGYELVTFKRTATRDRSGNPYWMGAEGSITDQLEMSAVLDHLSAFLAEGAASLDPDWELPAYHIRRSWLPTEVADAGAAFVPELLAGMKDLLSVLEEINGS